MEKSISNGEQKILKPQVPTKDKILKISDTNFIKNSTLNRFLSKDDKHNIRTNLSSKYLNNQQTFDTKSPALPQKVTCTITSNTDTFVQSSSASQHSINNDKMLNLTKNKYQTINTGNTLKPISISPISSNNFFSTPSTLQPSENIDRSLSLSKDPSPVNVETLSPKQKKKKINEENVKTQTGATRDIIKKNLLTRQPLTNLNERREGETGNVNDLEIVASTLRGNNKFSNLSLKYYLNLSVNISIIIP